MVHIRPLTAAKDLDWGLDNAGILSQVLSAIVSIVSILVSSKSVSE